MNRYLAYAITIAAFALIIALLLGYVPAGKPKHAPVQEVEEPYYPGGYPPGWNPGFGWEDLPH
jgi:hypothetical protein